MEPEALALTLPIRRLVEFLLRSGDIDNRMSRGMQLNAMQEGTRIHKKLQRAMGSSYSAEVPLRLDVPADRYLLTVEGRADGIFIKDDITCVDEIKGVYQDVMMMEEPVPVLRRYKQQLPCPSRLLLHTVFHSVLQYISCLYLPIKAPECV